MNFFATAFVEPNSKQVSLMLALTVRSYSFKTLVKTDTSNFAYDSSQQESFYLSTKSSFGGSVLLRHLNKCSGLDCPCVRTICATESSMDICESCKMVPGEFEIVVCTDNGVSYHNSSNLYNRLQLTNGTLNLYSRYGCTITITIRLSVLTVHVLYRNRNMCFEDDSESKSSIPSELRDLGQQWLYGRDATEVTHEVLQALQALDAEHQAHSSPKTVTTPYSYQESDLLKASVNRSPWLNYSLFTMSDVSNVYLFV